MKRSMLIITSAVCAAGFRSSSIAKPWFDTAASLGRHLRYQKDVIYYGFQY
jgi:hypothetical protein